MSYQATLALTALVKQFEPFRETPEDGKVGWGHRITGSEEEAEFAESITLDRARDLLAQDIAIMEHKVGLQLERLPRQYTTYQFDAMVSIWLDFETIGHSFVLKRMIAQDNEGVQQELDKAGRLLGEGTTAPRRRAEAQLYLTGTFE